MSQIAIIISQEELTSMIDAELGFERWQLRRGGVSGLAVKPHCQQCFVSGVCFYFQNIKK